MDNAENKKIKKKNDKIELNNSELVENNNSNQIEDEDNKENKDHNILVILVVVSLVIISSLLFYLRIGDIVSNIDGGQFGFGNFSALPYAIISIILYPIWFFGTPGMFIVWIIFSIIYVKKYKRIILYFIIYSIISSILIVSNIDKLLPF